MSDSQDFTLSNFRSGEVIADWPLGSGKRGNCCFTREINKRGHRISRTTTGKPKFSIYYVHACIADGSDDRIHIVGLSPYSESLSVMSSDMKHSDFCLFPGDENYDNYVELLKAV